VVYLELVAGGWVAIERVQHSVYLHLYLRCNALVHVSQDRGVFNASLFSCSIVHEEARILRVVPLRRLIHL
jgi:hypothetical protein